MTTAGSDKMKVLLFLAEIFFIYDQISASAESSNQYFSLSSVRLSSGRKRSVCATEEKNVVPGWRREGKNVARRLREFFSVISHVWKWISQFSLHEIVSLLLPIFRPHDKVCVNTKLLIFRSASPSLCHINMQKLSTKKLYTLEM